MGKVHRGSEQACSGRRQTLMQGLASSKDGERGEVTVFSGSQWGQLGLRLLGACPSWRRR